MPLLLSRPHILPLGSRRRVQQGVTSSFSSPVEARRTYASKSLPFSMKPKPRAYNSTRFSLSPSSSPRSTSTALPLSRAHTSTSNHETLDDATPLLDLNIPEPAFTSSSSSSKSSVRSSTRLATTTTIIIEPSHSLRAMQSVGSDTSPTDNNNTTWRHTTRYFNPSQISIPNPEPHNPIASPPWLTHDPDNHTERHIPPSTLQITNWNHSIDSQDQTYGPSAEDLADFIERRGKYNVGADQRCRGTRAWRPLIRLESLKKGIKRTVSLGIGRKRTFEARVGTGDEGLEMAESNVGGGRRRWG